MTRSRNLGNRHTLSSFFLLIAALVACAAPAFGQAYSVTKLKGLPEPTGLGSTDMFVNSSGEVAGNYPVDHACCQAFVWTASDGVTLLPTLGGIYVIANGINDSGEVAGYSQTTSGTFDLFTWTATGGIKDLGISGQMSGINNPGEIVGTTFLTGDVYQGLLWSPTSGTTYIGTDSSALGLNDNGTVVGYTAMTSCANLVPFYWTSAGGIQEFLGCIQGEASAVNNNGQVVGFTSEGFFWSQSTGMLDLGPVGEFSTLSINDNGQAVWFVAGETGPVVWTQAAGAQALNNLLPKGYSIVSVNSINKYGQIGAWNSINYYLLTPIMSTVLTSSANPSYFEQPVTFTATISSIAGPPPDGETVTFYDGSTSIGTGMTSGGVVKLTTSALDVRTHTIKAVYAADGHYASSTSNKLKQVVQLYASTTTLTSSPNPSTPGESVTLTATVTSAAPGGPTGEVAFKNGTTTVGTATLSAGKATLATTKLPVGSDSLTATYDGNSLNARSTSAPIIQVVNEASIPLNQKACPTHTTVSSSESPSYIGEEVTFSAFVNMPLLCNGIYTGSCYGTVDFYVSDQYVGSGSVADDSCIANFIDYSLAVGSHKVKAIFEAEPYRRSSTSRAITQVVHKGPITTSLTSSLNPAIYGQKITLTATLSQGYLNPPTGTVNFRWGNGAFSLGSGVVNGNGVATLTKAIDANVYAITADYSGDASNASSISPPLTQTVNQATSSATLTSSVNPSTSGESVTFTAEITSPTTTPTGPVTFSAGNTVLGTVELSRGKATITTSTLAVGSTTVTVTYPWNSDVSESSASVVQTVQ